MKSPVFSSSFFFFEEALDVLRDEMDEVVFEEFGFQSYARISSQLATTKFLQTCRENDPLCTLVCEVALNLPIHVTFVRL